MRPAVFPPLLAALSGVRALPFSDSNPQHLSSTLTGVPAPSSYPEVPSLTGLLPPEYWKSTPTGPSGWITGVPTPSGNNPWQRPDTSNFPWITGVTAPSSNGENPTQRPPGHDTSISPTPASTPLPEPTTLTPSESESSTSAPPTPTPQPPTCRPEWPTAGYTGPFRAAVIFVDFPDFPANTTIQELWDPIAFYPTELYNTMSYGKLSLELVPLLDKFYRMPAASSSYNYARGLTTEMHLKYINDALTAVGPDVSFTDVDALYIVPPKYATEISFSTSTGNDVTAPDNSTIPSTITFGQDLFFSWGPKTINHETGHAMGLPDLYPYDGGSIQQFVGGFDMMGVIGGMSPDYFAWHKWRLEWLEDAQIVCIVEPGTTEHRISPIEVADETRDSPKAIAIPIGATEYVMVEVRSELGVDEGACGTGVLLYTADAALGSGDGPVRVIDTKPGSGGCDAGRGGELNDAPLQVGEEWDTGRGVVVRVKAREWEDYVVEVERRV